MVQTSAQQGRMERLKGIASLGPYAMHRPDGMGADMYNERQNMRAAESQPDFTHDVVAVDSDGDVVFESEALFPNEVDTALDDYPEGENAPDGVSHYEIRER